VGVVPQLPHCCHGLIGVCDRRSRRSSRQVAATAMQSPLTRGPMKKKVKAGRLQRQMFSNGRQKRQCLR
jgi:hypothetical protein